MRRWGYELAARLNANLTTGQAGSFSTPDGNSRITTSSGLQFATQTSAGTRNGTTASR